MSDFVDHRQLLERYLDAHQRHVADIGRYVKMGRGTGLDALVPITPEAVERWKELARLEEEALKEWHEALARSVGERP